MLPFALLLSNLFALGSQNSQPDFDREIAPILATYCLECHKDGNIKGKLNLTTKAGIEKGGKSGPAVVSGKIGKIETSPLLVRVMANEMPPKTPLPIKDKLLLEKWVLAGAIWGSNPEAPIDPFRFSTSGRAGYDWWSLKALMPTATPMNFNLNPIDVFILEKLKGSGLSQNPQADKRTLLKRLSFDLIGLAPTPDEYANFLADVSSNAYEKQVDRLLASPHYGERWARHWLDVARFGETDGFERNQKRPNAWPYRDWVIRALNEDMPFDHFARLQIAGDVLEPNNPDAVRATGFLVGGVYNTVLGNDQMRSANRQDELEDLVGTVGQAFLGLTVNCARCHDHKFDPISMEDYYRMAATLSGVNHGERSLPLPGLAQKIENAERLTKNLETELEALEAPIRSTLIKERAKTIPVTQHPPKPFISWDLRHGLIDSETGLALQPQGPVQLTPSGARLADNSYLKSEPIGKTLHEKTMETWVQVNPGQQQCGAPVSLFKPIDATFDAIVYAELEKNRWMAGSDFFRRTKSFQSTDTLEPEPNTWVHLAITYHANGNITGYRDGKPYGQTYQSSGLLPFEAGQSRVLVGCRLEPAGGNKMFTGTIAQVRIYDRALTLEEVKSSFQHGDIWPNRREVVEKMPPKDQLRHKALLTQRIELTTELQKARSTQGEKVYSVVAQKPNETRILARGDHTKPGKLAKPGVVKALGELELDANASDAERRVHLARWMTSPENPLFARVAVNRLWLLHFGAGLVDTPSDFGFNGGQPSHPALLDWLATVFIQKKYSLKALHKLLVTCATYKQASTPRADALAKDVDNRLLWRMRKKRLEGEVLRDAMLQASGILNLQVGGPGFSDYKVTDTGNGTTYYEPFDSDAPELQRRSIYRFSPRGGETSMLDLFDCPDCATAAPKRTATTTPLQALNLWNGPIAIRLAGTMAEKTKNETKMNQEQVQQVYQKTLGRNPSEIEAKLAGELASQHGLRAVCRVLLNSNEFLMVE